jgi:hypothetical protein
MPEQMGADFEQVMAQCSRGCFTGLLRVRTRDGNGEVRFLSGIQDGIRFDSMEGDAALERLLAASDPEFEAISSLPPIDLNSTEPVPPEGVLARYHAAQLMRYCESNSLTCALELEVEGRVLTARYRLGELLSVEPDSEHTARLAEAKEGNYRFRLPRFELPANVQQRRSASAAPKPAPAAAAAAPAPKPAPVAAAKSAAALAETPLVGMKAVPVGSPPASTARAPVSQAAARAPAAAPKAKPPSVSPAPRSGAEPRPPAPAPRFESPSNAPPAVVSRREEPRVPAAQPARPAAAAPPPSTRAPAAASPAAPSPAALSPVAGARPAAAPASTPRREEPQAAPRSPVPASQQKPLEGLWVDAVKPPPQSAPLELESASNPVGGSGAPRGQARAEGLSSLAYKPPAEPAKPPQSAPQQQRSSAIYWVVAMVLLLAIAAAGWFVFGR